MRKHAPSWATHPPLWLALIVMLSVTAMLIWISGGVFADRVVPLGWSIALLAGLWFGRRWLVWSLATLYAILVLVKLEWLADKSGQVGPSVLHLLNILLTAALVHAALAWRKNLRLRLRELASANDELAATNEELAAGEKEIVRQNEELQAQAEELEQQAEELRSQTEELEQQAEELSLQTQELEKTNAEVNQRERTLHLLLHTAGRDLPEAEMMGRICETAVEFFAGQAAAAAVVEKIGSQVVLRAFTGLNQDPAPKIPFDRSLLTIAFQQRKAIEVQADGKPHTFQLLRTADGQRFQYAYVVPLWLADQPVGGLEVFSVQPTRWDSQQLQLLDWLADQCSRLWQITRLRQDLNRRVDELQETQGKLAELNQSLEQRVTERTAVAQQRAEQLRALALQLAQTEQRERRQLARLLHDHLQQLLVAAKLRLGVVCGHHQGGHVAAPLKEVDQLLDESIEASRSLTVELSPPILYDSGLSAALSWLAERKLQKHGLRVRVEADPAADPDSEEVAATFFSATRELLFNVMKHSGTDQARVKLALEGPDGQQQIVLTVEDRGRGFDVHAFRNGDRGERFGLFSIRERLLALGGGMQLEASDGGGTRVTLYAPRQIAKADVSAQPLLAASGGPPPQAPQPVRAANPRRPAKPADDGTIRVLLADDHRILREGLAGLLREQADIRLIGEASDGQMAVELTRELRPDVVVMDVSMPRMNGIEATRHIHQEMPEVRVIGLSMHGGEHIAQSLREAGAEAYVTKGGPSEALITAIRGR